MAQVTVIGVDLAKTTFQVHGNDARGNCILRRSLSRKKFAEFLANCPPALVGMEACAGAHYWGRKAREFGHQVKLMAPQHVKPYVTSNKDDANDAAACAEAVTRPKIFGVPIKTAEQLDIQALHRVRERRVKARTALINEIRGVLAEHGIVASTGRSGLNNLVKEILEKREEPEVSGFCRTTIADLAAELEELDERIRVDDDRIERHVESDDRCKRLLEMPGIGPISASALIASTTLSPEIKNGRYFSARLGLVPRHTGTGGTTKILGISKRGDSYLRSLLIHGARSAIIRTKNPDGMVEWGKRLRSTRGLNKASVALANKMARVIFRILSEGTQYDPKKFSYDRNRIAA